LLLYPTVAFYEAVLLEACGSDATKCEGELTIVDAHDGFGTGLAVDDWFESSSLPVSKTSSIDGRTTIVSRALSSMFIFLEVFLLIQHMRALRDI
jgi:hypothetical protein